MVTAKKPAAKKTTKASVQPTPSVQPREEEFRMPTEVKEWIDQASSRMSHMKTEIERLKEENLKLRRANKLMEQRVMNMSIE
jgi:regulator of replication initiation timing